MSRMPSIYRPPTGGPLRWQDDVTGILPQAVMAFFDASLGRTRAMTWQVELVRDYLEYYINAPCWDLPITNAEQAAELAALRSTIKEAKTVEALDGFIKACLEIGIDPL